MKENQRNQRDMEQRNSEQENMRNPQQQQDSMREVGQNREQNESLRDAEQGSGRSYDYGTQGSEQTENTSSGMGSGTGRRESVAGTTDMRDEQALGRNRNSRRQPGSGSGLAPKTGTTGSDYDGQNSI